MTAASQQILFPPGRVVQGSLYKAQDKDMDGRPRTFPVGHAKAGQPKISYFFAVAIPKQAGEAAWWATAWGQQALALAQAAWPQGQWQHPTFAWKIEDGDSQTPNKRGRKNANSEGFPGCWIVNFSSGFPPKIFLPVQGGAPQPIIEPDVVKLGHWVEVLGTIRSNETQGNPGIYVNHDMVAYRGRDKEIFAGPDPATVGFGQSAVPSHVTMAPVASGGAAFPAQMPQAGAPMGVPGGVPAGYPGAAPGGYPGAPMGAPGGYPSVPGGAPMGVPGGVPNGVPGGMPVGVQPHAGFIAPPVAGAGVPSMPGGGGAPSMYSPPAGPAAPSAPAAPVAAYVCPAGAPAGFRMANPQGARYESYRQNGWADAQLIQNGHMVKL